MGGLKLSKKEFERLKKNTVKEVIERKFTDIKGQEKMVLCSFFKEWRKRKSIAKNIISKENSERSVSYAEEENNISRI